jgi:hypothetical protein
MAKPHRKLHPHSPVSDAQASPEKSFHFKVDPNNDPSVFLIAFLEQDSPSLQSDLLQA